MTLRPSPIPAITVLGAIVLYVILLSTTAFADPSARPHLRWQPQDPFKHAQPHEPGGVTPITQSTRLEVCLPGHPCRLIATLDPSATVFQVLLSPDGHVVALWTFETSMPPAALEALEPDEFSIKVTGRQTLRFFNARSGKLLSTFHPTGDTPPIVWRQKFIWSISPGYAALLEFDSAGTGLHSLTVRNVLTGQTTLTLGGQALVLSPDGLTVTQIPHGTYPQTVAHLYGIHQGKKLAHFQAPSSDIHHVFNGRWRNGKPELYCEVAKDPYGNFESQWVPFY